MTIKTTIKTSLWCYGLSLFMIFAFSPDLLAQSSRSKSAKKSFKRKKSRQEQVQSPWRGKEQKIYDAIKIEEENWHAIALGHHVEAVLPKPGPMAASDSHVIPDYVNTTTSLAHETRELQMRVAKMTKEAATFRLKDRTPMSPPKSSIKVRVSAPKQAGNIKMSKAKRASRIMVPRTEDGIKKNLVTKELRMMPSVSPIKVPYELLSPMGMRAHSTLKQKAYHCGVDLGCVRGTPVMATAYGIVEYAGWAEGFGNFVKVSHGNGVSTIYGHLSSINVKEGQAIAREQQIGKVGSTGRSVASFLHYGIMIKGKYVDPKTFM